MDKKQRTVTLFVNQDIELQKLADEINHGDVSKTIRDILIRFFGDKK